jgi:hypothetical protein
MIEKIKRQLDRLEESMVPCDGPKVEFILAFVRPADDAQPRNVKYFKYHGMGKLERVNRDGSPWEDGQQ